MFDRRHFVYQFDKMFQHLPWKCDVPWPNSSPFSSPSVRIFAESGSTLNEKHLLFCSQVLMFSLHFFFYKPLWPDTETLRQRRWSHTPELWKASSVSPSRHAARSLLTRENCTWTGINLDPVCEIGTASGGWRTFRGELWTLHVAFGARPARIFSGIHVHTASAWIARQRGCTIVQGDQRWDKDKLLLNDFWHQLLSEVFNPTGSLQTYQKQILWLCYCPTFKQLPSGS